MGITQKKVSDTYDADCESAKHGTIRMASVTDKSQCHKCQGQKPESTMCLHKHKIGGK